MTTVVLLDAGGVLFDDVFETSQFFDSLSVTFGVKPERLRSGYAERVLQVVRGECTGVHAIKSTVYEIRGRPLPLGSANIIRETYRDMVVPNVVLMRYLSNLKGSHSNPESSSAIPQEQPWHITLANNEGRDWDYIKNSKYSHFELVDSLSSSWLIGCEKPTASYFALVLSRLNFVPSKAVLIDDSEECLAAAEYAGIDAIKYTGLESVAAYLESLAD